LVAGEPVRFAVPNDIEDDNAIIHVAPLYFDGGLVLGPRRRANTRKNAISMKRRTPFFISHLLNCV
jgi:hypothetical protein